MQKLTIQEVAGDAVEVRYIPIGDISLDSALWDKNAKKHDIDALIASIDRYGFVDPPKWDSNLNGGKGGIVFGNGRITAIVQALKIAKESGAARPKGIPETKDGEWCIPVKFGVDASSESEAMALAIDHNNLTMVGGGFSSEDIAKMWDTESYFALLSSIADDGVIPISIDEEAIADMMLDDYGDDGEDFGQAPDGSTKEIDPDGFDLEHTCPKCGFEFDAKK